MHTQTTVGRSGDQCTTVRITEQRCVAIISPQQVKYGGLRTCIIVRLLIATLHTGMTGKQDGGFTQ